MKPIKLIIVFFAALILGLECSGQQLKGRVQSEDGSGIGLASVKSLRLGVTLVTAEDGVFALSGAVLPDTLQVTRRGYGAKSIVVVSYDELRIELIRDYGQIEEVLVSTGYQKLRANEMAGAVQLLDKDLLSQQVGVNILDRLNHVSPGVRFDNNVTVSDTRKLNFTVRGISTINGQLDPLLVVDGFIYEGDIKNIDPNSVESVSILKDAAASSIWGARAGNGVLVISTKQGSTKPGYNFSIDKTTIFSDKPDLYDQFQLPAADFIDVERLLFGKGYFDTNIRRNPQNALTPAVELLLKNRKGEMTDGVMEERLAALATIDGRQQYMDYFMEHPLIDQYGLNLSGRSDMNRFNLFAGYTYQKNEYATKQRKLNLQFSDRLRLGNKVNVDFGIYYTNDNSKVGKPAYSSFAIRSKKVPYLQFVDENGEGMVLADTYRKEYTDSYALSGLYSWDYIPLEDYRYVDNETKVNEYFGRFALSYAPWSFLTATLAYQGQLQQQQNDIRYSEQSRYARVLINQFAAANTSTGLVDFPIPKGGIKSMSRGDVASYTLRGQVDVNKRWELFNLVGMAGWEMRQRKENGESSTLYGYKDDPLSYVAVDYTAIYPIAISLSSSNITGQPVFTETVNRFISVYSNWAASLMDRYGLTASMRSDGANIFGAQTNDKWSPFWSVGAFWNLDREQFMADRGFGTLKLRATYGKSGNVDLRRTPLPVAGVSPQLYSDFVGMKIGQLNDPALRWEKVETWNVGLDFNAWRGRIHGNVDFYQKKGVDLYGMSPYDYTAWGVESFVMKNVASMRGRGAELLLSMKNMEGRFSWQTTYNVSTNKNKTLEYYSTSTMGLSSFISSSSITPVPGKPLNAISAYKWGGLDAQGNPQGYLFGELSTDYAQIRTQASADETNGNILFVGSSTPQWFGSLMNTFAYWKMNLAFNLSFMADYYFRKDVTSYSTLFSTGVGQADFLDRWQNEGDELHTDVPSLIYPVNSNRESFYKYAEINILKADHIRFEYVRVGFSDKIARKYPFTLYLNVTNLGLLWTANKQGIDPMFQGSMKRPTTYAVGLNLNL
ncbi:SusC/RagA family TonB-linked outer membrane protein [Sphingobacterium sp. LRF_L2]|uniref:SusC/RagA family TonB-linked outer membrane protein n=1 Tax=Sphingobacterium sp. LRF_L2 TaxID=3369421 RepID=UPI003F5F2E27